MRNVSILIACLLAASSSIAFAAPEPPEGARSATPHEALARMPVREATIFKDGHALMVHEGTMPIDDAGDVVMDYLPTPVLGTFWPFSSPGQPRLQAVVAGQRKVSIERTALDLRALIEANVGADVIVTESPIAGTEPVYSARIVAVPARSSAEQEAVSVPGSGPLLPVKGDLVVLETAQGQKVLDIARIADVTFRDGIGHPKLATEEFRNLLTLKLDWGGRRPAETAEVGLIYLQRGLRWIPQYRVTIDGEGRAVVKLQATLVNEMVDLEDVTCRLVIGVPTFAFKDELDPIGLQQTIVQLAQQGFDSRLGNAIMTQAAGRSWRADAEAAVEAPAADLGPQVASSGQDEDLFIFTVEHVTLRRGQRMVVPVEEFALTYEDLFTLDIPFAPPPEVRASFGSEQQQQIARLLAAPKVIHKLRLTNGTKSPLTTAPALIFRGDQPLGQGLMTYTSAGGTVDLEITAAVDVKASRSDRETARVPNAAVWQGDEYGRVDLAGTITLVNFRKEPVTVEVARSVLGNAESADHGGAIEMLNALDQAGPEPYWWRWFSWPYWWYHFNGMGRVRWTVQMKPGETIDLGYAWNYYWR